MTTARTTHCLLAAILFAPSLLLLPNVGNTNDLPSPIAEQAQAILEASSVQGGLVVHLGCGDGRLTAALRASDSYLVHGLDADTANVEKAREHIRSLGLYGKVSADRLNGKRLPYVDDLVSLLVSENSRMVSMDEVLRVLAPGGAAFVKVDGDWTKTVMPWPKEIDQWSHYNHAADGNPVAHDTRVGPPRHVRWVAAPFWGRSHENARSIPAVVSAGGRLFCIVDEAPAGMSKQSGVPHNWRLVARDAFNGVVLWKARIADMPNLGVWGGRHVARRLVGGADRVYVTLGKDAPVSEIDAATGSVIRRFEKSEFTEEILLDRDKLLVLARQPASPAPRPGKSKTLPGSITCYDVASARLLWETGQRAVKPLSLVTAGGRVFFHDGGQVACLDESSGKELWAAPLQPDRTRWGTVSVALIALPQVVLYRQNYTFGALSADTGRSLWTKQNPSGPTFGGSGEAGRFFVMGGLVNATLDPLTGEVKRQLPPAPRCLLSQGHHYRCWRDKATDRFVISAKRGLELYDTEGKEHSRNDWVRGMCGVGTFPCNGLIYVPPDYCFCYPGVKLNGFLALAPGDRSRWGGTALEPSGVLEKGPAYSSIPTPHSPTPNASDWPTFRHDQARSGSTSSAVPPQLTPRWTVKLGGKLTQPSIADGRLFVGAADVHTLFAYDASDGRPLWSFVTGGRLDTPPTVYKGRVLLGSHDGWVYCLRATDGALAWRFRAAPEERWICDRGQVESAWPVHGGVLLKEDVAYVVAGRSSFLDGGLFLYGLDPLTGRKRHESRLDGPHPDLESDRGHGHSMDGALADVLVAGVGDARQYVYLRQIKLDRALKEHKVPWTKGESPPEQGIDHRGKPRKIYGSVVSGRGDREVGLHLFSTSGLLDDSYHDRTGWMFAKTWPGWTFFNFAPKAGQIVVFNDKWTFGAQQFTQHHGLSPGFVAGGDGYLLVADHSDNEPVLKHEHRYVDQQGPGFTRRSDPIWKQFVPLRIRAMALAGDTLFLAGPPDIVPEHDPLAAFEGRKGASLWVVSTTDGRKLAEHKLDSPPVFDGMAAATGRLYLCTDDGTLLCFGATK